MARARRRRGWTGEHRPGPRGRARRLLPAGQRHPRPVIGDPAALIGGISALFLQPLHPRAMAGVEQHSSFPDDFWPRLERTAGYVTTLAFADRATADRAVARVRGIHRRVRGVDPVTGAALLGRRPGPAALGARHRGQLVRRRGAAAEPDRRRPRRTASWPSRSGPARCSAAPTCRPAGPRSTPTSPRSAPSCGPARWPGARPAGSRWPRCRCGWSCPAGRSWTLVAAVAIGLLPRWAKGSTGCPASPAPAGSEERAVTAGLAALRAGMFGFRRATGRPAPPR